ILCRLPSKFRLSKLQNGPADYSGLSFSLSITFPNGCLTQILWHPPHPKPFTRQTRHKKTAWRAPPFYVPPAPFGRYIPKLQDVTTVHAQNAADRLKE